MKLTLRVRYYLWLAVFLLISVLVTLLVLHSIQLYELIRYRSVLHEPLSGPVIYFLVVVIALPLLLLIGWQITRQMLRPLRDMAQTAVKISAGNLSERIPESEPDDELSILVHTLNSAFDRYQNAVDRLQRFSSDASHQLRTPLTAIRSAGEIALQKSRTPDEYRETLESILEDVHRMVYIVEQLLMLSRLDADHVQAGFSRLNFCETIHNVVMRFEPLWKDKQIDMQLELENPLWVQGENALLEEALANLLDNAIRFTPVQGTIRVQASSSDTRVNMAICDSGPGISVDYRTQVFERFARIPGNESPGAGLGLAIVADIVSIHNGDIHVADNKPRGACFRITLNR